MASLGGTVLGVGGVIDVGPEHPLVEVVVPTACHPGTGWCDRSCKKEKEEQKLISEEEMEAILAEGVVDEEEEEEQEAAVAEALEELKVEEREKEVETEPPTGLFAATFSDEP